MAGGKAYSGRVLNIGGRDAIDAYVKITTNNTSDPTLTTDPFGIISTVTRDGVGSFIFAFDDDWDEIDLVGWNARSTTQYTAQLDTLTLTAGAQTAAVTQFTAAAAADSTSVVVIVTFRLYLN